MEVGTGNLRELNEALALWRGSPLSQFAYEEFAQAEIARLEELRLTALEAKLQAELELGRHSTLVGELQLLLPRAPAARAPLQAYPCSRSTARAARADALDAFERTRRALDEQLGIAPGPALRELQRKILEQEASRSGPPLSGGGAWTSSAAAALLRFWRWQPRRSSSSSPR